MDLFKLSKPSKSSPHLSRVSGPQDYKPMKSCFPRLPHAGKSCSGLQAGTVLVDRKEGAAPPRSPDHHDDTATPAHQPLLQRLPSGRTVREMQEVFAEFDTNSDGKISADELCRVFWSLGLEMTPEEAAHMVEEVDANGDGFIDMQEFMKLHEDMLQADEMSHDDLMRAAFDMFDLNKDGHITAQELQVVLTNLGGHNDEKLGGHNDEDHGGRTSGVSLEECHRMIRSVDRKGAGHVDIHDFKRMMMMPAAH